MNLKEALKVIIEDENLGDFVYNVRDSASGDRSPEDEYTSSWDLPRVKRFGEAVAVLEEYFKSLPEVAETD